jgi:hypothetical protein
MAKLLLRETKPSSDLEPLFLVAVHSILEFERSQSSLLPHRIDSCKISLLSGSLLARVPASINPTWTNKICANFESSFFLSV